MKHQNYFSQHCLTIAYSLETGDIYSTNEIIRTNEVIDNRP
ncbi:hypothetical protein YPPY04_0151 [Yersinia pestis PY-04]|nr:hypothetical protein YPPY04_2265 [Yersinia pestis PY-04]EIR09534.1 hypothetical protein YPPY04_0151 [Yersinia pestis PY-04]